MTWKSKLEKAAEEYEQSIWRLEPHQEPPDFGVCFKDGAKFARTEMMKEAQVLVEAIRLSIAIADDYADSGISQPIRKALVQYQKGTSDE